MDKPHIDILIDDPTSFLLKYIHDIRKRIEEIEYETSFINSIDSLKHCKNDILFLLGCKTIFSKEQLSLHKHNLVIHPSKLPLDRGSGAVAWNVIEGKNEIWISLFEANEQIDKGNIYLQESFTLEGHELNYEIREKQAKKTIELIIKFLNQYPDITSFPQSGESSFRRKRTPVDSELDINKSIKEQFNLIRSVDNTRYPAFFIINGVKYYLFISKDTWEIL